MLKAFSAITFLLLLFSCKQAEKYTAVDTSNIESFLSKYDTARKIDSVILDSVIIAGEKKITLLKNNPDSILAYVHVNRWLINLLNVNERKWPLTKKYLDNIIRVTEKFPTDSVLRKHLANSYYEWADGAFHETFTPQDTTLLYFEKAIALSKEKGVLDSTSERYCYKFLGTLYNILGDTKKTLTYYDLERKLIPADKPGTLAGNVVNTSICLRESGLIDSAINIIPPALKLPSLVPLKIADLLNMLSEAQLEKGLVSEAKKNVLHSILIADTLPENDAMVNEKFSMALKQKGIVERVEAQYDQSIGTLKKAIQVYNRIGNADKKRDAAKIYIELGKSQEAAGAIDSALKSYQFALHIVTIADSADVFSLPKSSQLYSENTIMEALDVKAAALVKKFGQTSNLKYLETAVQCYKLAFVTEQKLMKYFSYDESKLIMLKTSKARSEKAIAICWQLQQATNDARWAENALLFAETSKALVLLGSIKKNIAGNSALQNDPLFKKTDSLKIRLSYLEKKMADESVLKDRPALAQFQKQMKEAEGQLLLAETDLSRSNHFYRTETNKEDDLSIDVIKKKLLDSRTGMIEYFLGDSASYIFSLTKNTQPVLLKGHDSLSFFIQSFLSFFTDKNKINNDPAGYQSAAFALYRQLGLASIDTTAIKKLVIIPDGDLNFVPFEALVTSTGTAANPQRFSYVIRQQQIAYSYSLRTLLKQLEYKTSTSGITAFAPAFSNGERNQAALPYTVEELNAIKKERPEGNYFLQQQALLNNFKINASTSAILHIATHASADTSGGAQPVIQFYDSTLLLQELYSMHINAQLVVLSGCETGIGVINKSEGAMSLARGFYYAGAKNIITSLWSVEDKSTAAIFSDFYHTVSGDNYPEALYKAKLNYLNTASVANASPYYWAGFVYIGHERPAKKKPAVIWILLAAGAILLGLTVWKNMR